MTEPAGVILCFASCWLCRLAEEDSDHPFKPHTWMDDEDFEHAKRTGQIPADATMAGIAETHPCSCGCAKNPKKEDD